MRNVLLTCLSILLICALCFTGCDKADGGSGSKGSDTTKNEAGSRGSTLNVLKWDAPGNEVNANELTAEITKEYGENYEVKLNKKIPCIFGDTDIFGIMKVDFDKNFVKI